MRLPWRRSQKRTEFLARIDDYLAHLVPQQRAQLDAALAVRREILRRSIEEPDDQIDDEMIERCCRESTEMLMRRDLLDLVEKTR